jgi:hypothetical protein
MEVPFSTQLELALERPPVEVMVQGKPRIVPQLTLEELLSLDGQLANLINEERMRNGTR